MSINKFTGLLMSLIFLPLFLHAQILQPAKLIAQPYTQQIKVGDVVELIFKASIDKNWHLYTVGFDPDCGPIMITVSLEKNSSFEVVGDLVAVGDKLKHEKIFNCDVRIFENTGEFRQKIKVLLPSLKISGVYKGQVCTDLEGKCVGIEGDILFENFNVTGKAESGKQNEKLKAQGEKLKAESEKLEDDSSKLKAQGSRLEAESENHIGASSKNWGEIKGPILDPALIKDDPAKNSLVGFFILAFVAGLLALLTPCVFPMIPMTVSFFTQGRSKAQALIYGLSIIGIYTLIGATISPLMGPETANHLSTEWLPNLIFFIVFIVFGLSFLGLFDISLPGKFINKVDQQAEKGGLTGVFFMAFTLVLVSFSCTGPLVGSILVSSAGGEFLKPIVGMFAFSLAFAIPFTLFAFFPSWLRSMPKSGGWLNTVKVVLGFVEIALAFKFLSIADQAFHWGILDREINIAIWIVIVALIGIYLMKGFRLPGDTGKDAEDKVVSVLRITLSMVAFTFVIYLTPGMWGAPLKALAGYLPPLYTHDFNLLAVNNHTADNEVCEEPTYADLLHLPHGLDGYFDYKQALACARMQNKPLFIDFTGHGCTNCREMEAVVWADPQVLAKLKNDFVVVALYVDDKTELPEAAWYTSTYDKKIKKTIGKQNADLQIANLNNNAQPFYVLVGNDERVLVSPYGYDKDVDDFIAFLEEGEKKFKALAVDK